MAAVRGLQGLSRKACRIVDVKFRKSLPKSQSSLAQVLSCPLRTNGRLCVFGVSPKAQQLLSSVSRSSKWSKCSIQNFTRSSCSSAVCLLGTGNTSLIDSLCSGMEEVSTEGDEDSTNRKKRIYLTERLNDDP